jgi:GNAT superfamily N-acetyltransferase
LTDLGIRADLAIRTFYRTFAVMVGGRVIERDGVVACLGVHPSPIVTNTAWRSEPTADPAHVIRTIDAIYREAGFVGSLLTSSRSDEDLEAAAGRVGRHVVVELPVMVMERPAAPTMWPPPPPPATAARAIDPVADLAVFRSILIDGFFDGDDTGRSLIDATFARSSSLAEPTVGAFIGELDGRPASVAGAWLLGTDAGIGWVATLPDARRRGLGALVTARAVEYAFEHGAEMAALQASPVGRPVYERIGFATVGLDRIWEPGPA